VVHRLKITMVNVTKFTYHLIEIFQCSKYEYLILSFDCLLALQHTWEIFKPM